MKKHQLPKPPPKVIKCPHCGAMIEIEKQLVASAPPPLGVTVSEAIQTADKTG